MKRKIPPSARILLKLVAAAGLIVVLLLFSGTDVDFIYAAF